MNKPEKSSPEFAELLGAAICGLSRYFVGVPYLNPIAGESINGRDKLDPVYVAVTEGRDGPGPAQRKAYSSCGDQLHAILERLGVTHPKLNRASLGQYHSGGNIIQLQQFPFSRAAKAHDTMPPAGSLCLMWNTGLDAHAFVLHGAGSDAAHVLTANYGAGGMSSAVSPGANLSDSPLVFDALGKFRIGASRRVLQSYITPASLIPYLGEIDLTGAIVTDEVIQALGARWDHA